VNFPTRLIATGFYSGYAFVAPGTVGSAVALVIYLLLPPLSVSAWVLLLGATFAVGVHCSALAEREWGPDPSPVVIDEFVGFFATVFMLPQSVGLAVVAFILFRALDILKPPPARQAEALPGGWGVVMDDLVAGAYANLLLRAALWAWWA